MKRIIIANWKMSPSSIGEAKKLFHDVRAGLAKQKGLSAIVAPPFPYIAEVRKLSMRKRTSIAAQDVYHEASGPHTGAASISMLKSLGVSHVIVGHSERRADGDTDRLVNAKVRLILKSKLAAVVCVGERERDGEGEQYSFVAHQIKETLSGVKRSDLVSLIIAYEPVWAISSGDGRGETATSEHAHEMKLYIQKILADLYGRKAAMAVPIIYGGSVNPSNARDLLTHGEADGFLVGGASLDPKAFTSIVQIAAQV